MQLPVLVNNLLENISDICLCIDNQQNIIYINSPAERIFNILSLTREEVLGRCIWDILPEFRTSKFYANFLNSISQHKAVSFEEYYPFLKQWLEVRLLPGKDGLTILATDRTSNFQVSEGFFKAFKHMPHAMGLLCMETFATIDVNDAFEELTGYKRKEILWRSSVDLDLWSVEEREQAMQALLATGSLRDFVAHIKTKSGKRKTGLFSADIIDLYGQKHILWTFNDITQLKNSEMALENERQKFKRLLDELPGLVFVQTEDYKIHYANKKFQDIFGDLDDRTCHEKIFSKIEPCDDCITAIVFKTNQSYTANYMTLKDRIYDIYQHSFDIDGTPAVVKIALDVTERKNTENEFLRLERLNLIGQMAAGVAHEIRNPMTTVRGFLQLLKSKTESSKHIEYYNLMISELDRANLIITDFLSLSKNSSSKCSLLNLNTLVNTLYPLLLADAMNHNKDIQTELNHIPELPLNEKEICQLILNLSRNGFEAMDSGGILTIKTFTKDNDVVLAIQDEGKGIDPEVLKKIGTPFHTTKSQGTGLGLAVCYSIAQRHNAEINIDTGPLGTTFFITFKQLNKGQLFDYKI